MARLPGSSGLSLLSAMKRMADLDDRPLTSCCCWISSSSSTSSSTSPSSLIERLDSFLISAWGSSSSKAPPGPMLAGLSPNSGPGSTAKGVAPIEAAEGEAEGDASRGGALPRLYSSSRKSSTAVSSTNARLCWRLRATTSSSSGSCFNNSSTPTAAAAAAAAAAVVAGAAFCSSNGVWSRLRAAGDETERRVGGKADGAAPPEEAKSSTDELAALFPCTTGRSSGIDGIVARR
mmetsp:Transcript_33026/g.95614  ORF Transcript_33026/g.95614 Transcript_33026/m.95614 type:complete len:234 (+) Transcript_33026:1546-2247(+)